MVRSQRQAGDSSGGASAAPPAPSSRASRARKASLASASSPPSVRVFVNGRSLLLSERLLSDALAPLRLSIGGYVSLESYASSVALALAALERGGVVTFST